MPWPTMADYQEAIQSPRLCFADPELQQGTPLLNTLGLPKPVTGAFASVYQLSCGRKQYAVRCFLRYHPDQELRYDAISKYLRRVQLPFMVHFTLLQRGIRVRGEWYPILKMEWVDGLALNTYVEQNLGHPARLGELADRFYQVMSRLNQVGIAHGDLQHGNLLVVNHDIRLIDYDGMYVPSLEGMRSHELGHRNYQHPARGEGDFGLYIDNFSAWTIYTSLKALSMQPSLWRELNAGDECLLFRHEDFVHADASKALQRLAQLPDGEVGELAQTLRAAVASDLRQVPPLAGTATPRFSTGAARRTVAGWLTLRPEREEADETLVSRRSQPAATSYHGADWVLDYIEPPAEATRPAEEAPPRILERYVISGYCVLDYLLLAALPFGLAPALALAVALVGLLLVGMFLGVQYSLFPEVRAKRRLLWESLLRRSELAGLRRRAQGLAAERKRVKREEIDKLDTIDRAIEDAINQELVRFPFDWRDVPGVPMRLGLRLRWFGVRTAADVVERRLVRVNGIRQEHIDSLLAWRTHLERQVWENHARSIRHWYNTRVSDIRREYSQQRQMLLLEERAQQQQLDAKQAELDQLRQALDAYEDVTFATYLRWVF